MTKRFTYCFEPNKLSLHGYLERQTIEELLLRQQDATTWTGAWSSERAWQNLAQWIKMLLNATAPKHMPDFDDHCDALKDSEDLNLSLLTKNQAIQANAGQEKFFEIDIENLKNIDSVGWASLIHLLNYIQEFKHHVQLIGLLSHHRALIRLYQLETFLNAYLSEIEVVTVSNS